MLVRPGPDPVLTLDDMRRFAVTRSLFGPTTLVEALGLFGFVQADPIRAPARAQDLTLRHRVVNYHAGDLERLYPTLAVEEDVFINYGFLPRAIQALMHPRPGIGRWPRVRRSRAEAVLAFVRERGVVHPREVDAHFAHGTVTNYWGGASSATTHLLNALHYAGLLRVARRAGGIRIYAAREQQPGPITNAQRRARIDALVDVAVGAYAPVPAPSLSGLVGRLRYAVPQWRGELRGALQRAMARLSRARAGDVEWYWPPGDIPTRHEPSDRVRLLAPFDPLVWDRRRFELFWGWAYRFEAYTPGPKRKLGYYALPLLWRDRVIGWANVTMRNHRLHHDLGFVQGRPRERAFGRELEAEMERLTVFLGTSLEAPEEA